MTLLSAGRSFRHAVRLNTFSPTGSGPAALRLLRRTRIRSRSTKTANSNPACSIPSAGWIWNPRAMIWAPIRGYNRMQSRSPLLTQLESSLLVYYLGDLFSQVIDTNIFVDGDYRPIGGLRAMLVGGIIAIPSYQWYMFLGRNFNYALGHWTGVTIKVLISQTVFTPLFNIYFFGMHSLLSGAGLRETERKVREKVPVSWKNSWIVWPPLTAFSFTYIKPQNRNVFAGIVAIFWQSYLLYLNKLPSKQNPVQATFAKPNAG